MLGECVSQPKLPSYDIRAILLNCRHVRYIAYAVAVRVGQAQFLYVLLLIVRPCHDPLNQRRVVNINDAVLVDVAYLRILSGCWQFRSAACWCSPLRACRNAGA